MRVGVPREIKPSEYRVGLTPSAVREYVHHGHSVVVEHGAGVGAGYGDVAYRRAGAEVVANAKAVFDGADLIVKVKEPQKGEWGMLQPRHILFTYLHLAPDPAQADGLLKSGCAAIAYETVTDARGGLPLLAPMSEVAGRIAVFSAAETLLKHNGGMGLLLCGVPGVAPARVCVLGGGVVGANAARMAAGLGAEVVVVDRHVHQHRAGTHARQVLAPHQLGRGRAGAQHRADHHVGPQNLVLDRVQGGVAGQDPAHEDVVQLSHARNGALDHHDLGAQARGHPRGVGAHHAAAQHTHPRRRHARHAA